MMDIPVKTFIQTEFIFSISIYRKYDVHLSVLYTDIWSGVDFQRDVFVRDGN